MKVAHLVYSFEVGGLERIVANCITSMPAGTKHTVIALRSYSPEFVESIAMDVEVICLDKPEGQSWKSFYDFHKVLRKVKPDVLHSYNLASLEYQFVGWLNRIPMRLHAEHGRDISDPTGSNKKYQFLRRVMSRFVHKIVSVSDDLHQWLINDVGTKPSKCQLIRNGVNTDAYNIEQGAQKEEQQVVFGHVARLQSIKNQQGLIEAYFMAAAEDASFKQNTKLIIVGTGALESSLKDYVASQEDSVLVEFWGERHDMPEVYKAFNVFVMASHAEGIPMTMLEAMSSGLPVLSTAVGGIPEITTTAFADLVPPKSVDELAKGFLRTYQKRDSFGGMGQKARENVIKNFSQEKMVKDYYSLYEQGLRNVRN
ncbi:glycosyltransferase [Alteromonadaceae bacterium M269]|nr:glycosyltransferase [Alteromonadaceae bacterium M269]